MLSGLGDAPIATVLRERTGVDVTARRERAGARHRRQPVRSLRAGLAPPAAHLRGAGQLPDPLPAGADLERAFGVRLAGVRIGIDERHWLPLSATPGWS